jgi:hypothetical protein
LIAADSLILSKSANLRQKIKQATKAENGSLIFGMKEI